MSRRLTFRMALASAALCALVGVAFVLLLLAIRDLRHTSQLDNRADEVIAAANHLQKLLVDLQSGQRGFVITHDESFLEPWRSARIAFPREAKQLERLVVVPAQDRRARALTAAGLSYIREWADPVVALARKDPVAARRLVATARGKRLADTIRRQFAEFAAGQKQIDGERERRSSADADRAVAFGLAGLGGSVLLILLFTGYLSRLIVAPVRRVAAAAENLSHGEFRTRVPERGAGEIGELGRSFNAMASSLEESRDELESQNAELELQTAELEENHEQLTAANDELAAQRGELENALAELAQEKERLDLLFGFGELLAHEIEHERMAASVLQELGDFVAAEIGTLYLAAPEDAGSFLLATTRSIDPARLPERIVAGEGLAGRALAEARTVGADRGAAELRTESLGDELAVQHELHLPLSVSGRLLGVLSLGRVGDRPFAEEEVDALEHLAAQAAVAVSNAVSFRDARRLGNINRAVLDATLDGITLTNPAGEVVLQNAAQKRLMEDLFEIPPDATVAEATNTLAERTTDPEHFNARMAEIVGDPDYEGSDKVDLLSGRSYTRYTAPVRSAEGEHIGRLWIIRETTAEREAERLKTELVATVSHELRTPLASIMGFAELLTEREYDKETQQRFLQTIRSESTRLTSLVTDFLDLERIESGRFRLALEPFDLAELVREVVQLYSAQSDAHELVLEAPQKVRALGERDRIAQVLGNLLSNAIKYSPDGGRVEVRIEEMSGIARVSVADSGLGIPTGQQRKVFSKFFRADSSDTREIGGTGLGLALCKEIVDAHGGNIDFSSVEGRGSTFWFELPVSTRGRDGARPRVLVAEDESDAGSLFQTYLADADYAVEVVTTGEEALARVHAEPPAVICLDISVGGDLDGWAVLSRLKEDPSTSAIPVVVCTAGNGRREASALGAADFLSKPIRPEELRSAVERLLPAGRGSVLVVDDEETVRSLLIETLSGNGFELREAADGEEALAKIAARPPDAIVLDLLMPTLDGFEVLERLQADSATRNIPVIVLTARQLSAAERSTLKRRASALLEKNDYSGDELRALVERALG